MFQPLWQGCHPLGQVASSSKAPSTLALDTSRDEIIVFLLQVYDLNKVAKDIELPGAFILGAGAVSSRVLGINGEVSM